MKIRYQHFIVASMVILQGCASTRIVVKPDPLYAPVAIQEKKYSPPTNGSIYQEGRSVRLFEDNKAFRVGDILSVTLSESTTAKKAAATNTSKQDDLSTSATGTLLGITPTFKGANLLANSLTGNRAFAGSGDTSQSNSLTGEIAVTITRVFPNGNLEIRGEKLIGLTHGSEYIRLSGFVRPQDVSSGNIIVSNKIANSRLYYGGGGVVAESNAQGWLSRFFSSPVMPF